MDSKITEDLIKTGKHIRDKYRALKQGKILIEEQRQEVFKPLKDIFEKKSNINEQEEGVNKIPNRPPAILPQTPSRIPVAIQQGPVPDTLSFGRLASYYLSKHMDKNEKVDLTYGLRREGDKFKIGNTDLNIIHDKFVFDDATFPGTQGLWELLTMSLPKDYTEKDLKAYKEIVIKTNAHKRGYNPDAPISSNKHVKYTKIIAPMFSVKEGTGLKIANDNKVDYIYWDDPNELINRLRLLYYS